MMPNKLRKALSSIIGMARANPADAAAIAAIPGGTVLVPAYRALKRGIDKAGPPVAEAMQKNPEFKKAVTMGLLKMGQLTSMRDEISKIVGKQKTAEWPGPIKFLPKGPERDRQLARLKREHTTRSKSTSAQKGLMDDLKFHAEEVYDKSVIGKGGIANSRYWDALDQIGQGKLKTRADVTSYLNKTAAKKAWAALAKTAFAPPISTKPIDTSVSSAGLKSGKISPPGAGSAPSKNAGAPKGARVVVNKKGMVWDKNAPVTTRA